MTDDLQKIPDAQAVIDVMKALHAHKIEKSHIEDKEIEYCILPSGMRIESLKKINDEYRTKPERRTGTAKVTDLASFIEHAVRFKNEHSAIFGDDNRAAPGLTCVLNYHEGGSGNPQFGDHRTFYPIPFSEEWKLWQAQNKIAMAQPEFAQFLEDRIADVLMPPENLRGMIKDRDAGGDFGDKTPDEILADYASKLGHEIASPTRLVELSRGLSLRVNETVQNVTVLQTGEGAIQYTAEHTDADQKPLKVPGLFLIGIPVFHNGPHYRIAVRLRYRHSQGVIKWFFELYRDDAVLDHAFNEVCAAAKEATGLTLIMGTPETV